MIPVSLHFLMLLFLDQLVLSYELVVMPKYFHLTAFNSMFCILLQVTSGPGRNKGKADFCREIQMVS